MKVSLFGCGVYGLAIASALAKNNHDVWIWTSKDKLCEEFKKTKQLKSIIDYKMPNNMHVSTDINEVLEDSRIIYITSAANYVTDIAKMIKPVYDKDVPVCIASKGIESQTCRLLSSVVREILHTNKISVISGPTFAKDMINEEPVALAIAGYNPFATRKVMNALKNDTLKLRKSSDIIGIQICGSVKNIIAIASGILEGLGYSDSTKAFLINESLHDIKKLIKLLGGKQKTILSFAGVGDLLMTSMSKKSRNYSFGVIVGSKGKKEIKEFLDNNTVEGYHTLKIVLKLLKKKKIDIPLIKLIDDIIENKKNPHELADFLISKD